MVNKRNNTDKKKRFGSNNANMFSGRIYILNTFNNNMVTITDLQGAVLFSGSSGAYGFKGARKSTVYASQVVTSEVVKKAFSAGMKNVDIIIGGIGVGRDIAVRTIGLSGINILSIKYRIGIPHNGARAKKTRRV